MVYQRSQLLDAHPRNRITHDPMNEIIEKYEAKLEFLDKAVEQKRQLMDQDELEMIAEIKILLKEVVTDLRAIRAFSK